MGSNRKTIYRRFMARLRTRTIKNRDLPELLFGQQHIQTQSFFRERFGQYHTIRLRDTPHYDFLNHHLDAPCADHAYSKYLECSWDYYYGREGNTPQRREKRTEDFLRLYRDVASRRKLGEKAVARPIEVCQRPNGGVLIVDGNHRAAVALKLGLDLRAVHLPPRDFLRRLVDVPDEYFGTKRLDLPYQGIWHRGQELIKGRRPDLYERLQRIPDADLQGRTVLDLGCNVGMNCYLAAERGAVEGVGVEASPRIASAAVRLNAFFAAPCRFIVHDLNEEIGDIGRFDTVLCFSLVKHLKSTEALVATVKRAVGKVLYFEGHAGTSQQDYDFLLNSEIFFKIECIGYGRDGIHSRGCTRPLFRCQVEPNPSVPKPPSGAI